MTLTKKLRFKDNGFSYDIFAKEKATGNWRHFAHCHYTAKPFVLNGAWDLVKFKADPKTSHIQS